MSDKKKKAGLWEEEIHTSPGTEEPCIPEKKETGSNTCRGPVGSIQMPKRQETEKFKRKVWDYYRRKGRNNLPWRNTADPYRILVSEIMLQQTGVQRVLSKYQEFITAFPDFYSLSCASLKDVLGVWKGMGYNRRAIALRKIAHIVVTDYSGTLPRDRDILEGFPGIGPATSASVIVFAYNIPAVFIETNIRRVLIHCLFSDRMQVSDREILPLVELTLDTNNPREWYYALMDAGAAIGRSVPNPNSRSSRYRQQPPFEGSDRQLRGRVLGILLEKDDLSDRDLLLYTGADHQKLAYILRDLEREGFLVLEKDGIVRLGKN